MEVKDVPAYVIEGVMPTKVLKSPPYKGRRFVRWERNVLVNMQSKMGRLWYMLRDQGGY